MDGGGGGSGGGGSGMPEIRLPPSRGNNHVPEMNSAARSRVLTRIMKDQAQFLNTRSQPSDDFGAGRCVCFVGCGGMCACMLVLHVQRPPRGHIHIHIPLQG
jgi:hypothetical protein